MIRFETKKGNCPDYAVIEFSAAEVKLAGDASKTGVFEGYGSVFGNTDSYGDVVAAGAFKESLREWEDKGLAPDGLQVYPPMLLQHGGGMFGGNAMDLVSVGRWLSMEENSKGLKVKGQLFEPESEMTRRLIHGMNSATLSGMSIGFRVREAVNGTKPNEPRRTLTNIDLMELSIVTFPANPKTRVTGVKGDFPTIRELEQILARDAGLSVADAKALLADGYKAIKGKRDAAVVETDPSVFDDLKRLEQILRS